MSKRSPHGDLCVLLLLRFLEDDVFLQFFAVFLELNLAGDKFLVFARPIRLACLLVFDLDEIIL